MAMLPEITYIDRMFVPLIADFFKDDEEVGNTVAFGMQIHSLDTSKLPQFDVEEFIRSSNNDGTLVKKPKYIDRIQSYQFGYTFSRLIRCCMKPEEKVQLPDDIYEIST